MPLRIYHNPRCSKSRQTLALLQSKGLEPEVIEYLSAPPDKATLEAILRKLEMEPRDLMRKKEGPYKALDLGRADVDRDSLIAAMVENPILIERPIVVSDKGAAIGRPPEAVLTVL